MLIDGHFIGGPCDQAVGKEIIRNPYSGEIVGTAAEGGFNELRTAIHAADDAFQSWRLSSPEQRRKLLEKVAASVRDRRDELALLLTDEVGKPIAWSRAEVDRLAITFEIAARETGLLGEVPIDIGLDPRGKDYRASTIRQPVGVIFGIVPYNWPFNLAAHKLAPALASGNTVVLKPSPLAPLSTLTLARIIHESGAPHGVVNAVTASPQATEKALQDPRVKMLSFTGSAAVGWRLKQLLFDRKVTLELGGDATAIVCEDANLEWAVSRIIPGAFGYAGQICISIQHVLVHTNLYAGMRNKLIESTLACPTGDPRDEKTVCGPMIDSANADRVLNCIEQAKALGANVLAGGSRVGNVVSPTLLEDIPFEAKLGNEEAFGPIVTLAPFDTLEDAVHKVNQSKFGIHCGIFTNGDVEDAVRDLDVGGVVINDYPTLRFDALPYGGQKQSGFGREGVRFAIEEMTVLKSIVYRY